MPCVVDVESTIGASPVTVISAVVDSDNDRFTVAVASRVTRAFRSTLPKPESSAVTEYWPGGIAGNR